MYENICGIAPINFKKVISEGSNYIFIKDPSFSPITLKNFFGSVVQVNSFEECFYYAELGWSNSKITILEILNYCILFVLLILSIYAINKNKILINNLFLNVKKYLLNSNLQKVFIFSYIVYQIIISYNYVKNKSLNLKPFIDEYVSLASNYHFFTDLNFSAGGFLGGSFSVYLTSGPLSALGSVLGWSFTNNFFYARISNYFWIVFLIFGSLFYLSRTFNLSKKYYPIFLVCLSFLIPWWHGYLYSLGEIPSAILLLTAMLTFKKNRKLSLTLFSLSIFLGKFLNFLVFGIFYIFELIQVQKFKVTIKDAFYFFLPLVPWFLLIQFTYSNNGLVNYFRDLYIFIGDSSASGLQERSSFAFSSIKYNILNSEFSSWNNFERMRIALLPLVGIFLIFKNKKLIDIKFGNITLPIIVSILSAYSWFWLINPLKWMRYSQHFTVLLVFLIVYLSIFEIFEKKFDYFISAGFIFLYLDNTKAFIKYYFVILFLIYLIQNKDISRAVLLICLNLIITFDISFSVLNKTNNQVPILEIQECTIILNTDECRNSYFEILSE
tara:strand:+ start:703 stop:2364 length:1662 start_codon:yes stop_codon:yes gene_type:complete